MKIDARWAWKARKIVILGMVVSILVVFGSLAANYYFDDERVAKRELELMAKDYYENYFYEKFIKERADGVGTIDLQANFEPYREQGLPLVRLRQLLLYNGEKQAERRGYFAKNNFSCDTNKTTVKLLPQTPYGRKDYRIEYEVYCKKQ
ncbi:MAG: hypothetical protein Q4A30_00185 [Candidatus Saccharibacteria bacterium]|nr:hypothetical protein [Candidatus Saccharibacteria bacterium]